MCAILRYTAFIYITLGHVFTLPRAVEIFILAIPPLLTTSHGKPLGVEHLVPSFERNAVFPLLLSLDSSITSRHIMSTALQPLSPLLFLRLPPAEGARPIAQDGERAGGGDHYHQDGGGF